MTMSTGRTALAALALFTAGCPSKAPATTGDPAPPVGLAAAAPKVAGSGAAEKPKPAGTARDEDRGRYGPRLFALPKGCGPTGKLFACNPLTNAGCHPEEEEACDDDDNDDFACFPDSDHAKEGEYCHDKHGPSCAAGLTCDTESDTDLRGFCRKYCCSDSDCAAPKKCKTTDREFGSLGVCDED